MLTRVIDDPAIAAQAIRQGQLVALPTETVYGLGGDAFNPQAVAQIFAAKSRPAFDPLIVHINSREQLHRVTSQVPPAAEPLIEAFWPGPLTLVLPRHKNVPHLVTSGLPSVGVRWPAHPLMQAVINASDTPIAAPSANRFGQLSPTTAQHVRHQLAGRISLILDGGPCQVGIESTIVDASSESFRVLRWGGVSAEQLAPFLGDAAWQCAPLVASVPAAPGQLAHHYAPRTPLIVVDDWPTPTPANAGALCLESHAAGHGYRQYEALADTESLAAAATQFFDSLYRLDSLGLTIIVAHRFPDRGLGRAINDRLARAAATFG